MKQIINKLVILTAALSVSAVLYATSPLAFLEISPMARAAGMGNAVIVNIDGAGSIFYNPAALTKKSNLSVHFGIMPYYEQDTFLSLAGAYTLGKISLGLGFNGMFYSVSGTSIDANGKPTENSTSVEAHEEQILVSGAANILQTEKFNLDVGVAAKAIMSKLDQSSLFTVGIDVGSFISLPVVKDKHNINAAVVVKNIGIPGKYQGTDADTDTALVLPLEIGAGVGYATTLIPKKLDLDAEVDLSIPVKEKLNVQIGASAKIIEMFRVRAGFQTGVDSSIFSMGLGVNYNFGGKLDAKLDWCLSLGKFTGTANNRFDIGIAF
jgi:hypothetical protein